MIGLRYEVGGDWKNYLIILDDASDLPFLEVISSPREPAYTLLNWFGSRWGSIYLVNTVCAILFSWGLLVFCRAQPLPWLALTVAIPYLVIVVAMGYSRQGVAIGIAMLGIVSLTKGQILRFVFWVGLAALFHKSAVILIPLALLSGTRQKLWILILAALAGLLLFVLILLESIEFLNRNYLEAEYQSAGAGIRIAMNGLPALIFLMLRRKFLLPEAQRTFWTWMALWALVFVGLLAVSPSSAAVDRVALYWIPLQIFVWSRLPLALSNSRKTNLTWIYYVSGYSAAVQFVWLFFAVNSAYWLPYKFYPWESLWL